MHNWRFNPDYSWYPQKTGLDTAELRELVDATFAAQTIEELNQTSDNLVNYYNEQSAMATMVRPSSLLAIYDDIMNIYPTGECWRGGDASSL